MKKYILLFILNIMFIYSWAQVKLISYTLETPETTTKNYVARDFVEMKAGFSFSSNGTTTFSAATDPSLIFDVDYDNLLDNNDLTVDKTLPVGTIAGQFNVSASGGATYQVPIKVAPGTRGMQPNLSLVYNSQAGNGLLGMGWNLAGISAITRVPKTIEQDGEVVGVDLTSTDRFALDGNRLNVTSGGTYGANGTVYGTEMETFVEVTSYGGSTTNGPAWFKVKTSDGKIIEYGNGNGSCFTVNSKNIYWKISKITDQAGNYMTFHYGNTGNEHVILEIKYTGYCNIEPFSPINNPYNSIKFHYEKKVNDNNISYIGSEVLEQTLLLRKINIIEEGNYVKTYEFKYGTNDLFTFLNEIVETGLDNTQLNSTKLQYNKVNEVYTGGFYTRTTTTISTQNSEKIIGDFNGDGIQDFILNKLNTYTIYLSKGDFTFQTVTPDSNVPVINIGICAHDYNGDGIDEFYVIKNNNIAKLLKVSNNLIVFVANQPDINIPSGCKLYSFDVDGDGKPNEVILNSQGHINNILGITYTTPPDVTIADKKYFNDFNGNGKIDFFYRDNSSTTNVIYIYEYDGHGGFDLIATKSTSYNGVNSPEFEVFGDFNGDGKQDYLFEDYNHIKILFFKNGTLEYNLDYTLADYIETTGVGDNQEEIFCADFNGDGKSDILKYFLDGSTPKAYVYYSFGSGFIAPEKYITGLPVLKGAEKLDLNGDGKSDLYTKFMDGYEKVLSLKPYSQNFFLSSVTNGIGYKTDITYLPLTTGNDFYSKGSNAIYPVIDFQGALYAVSSVKTPNGIGGISTTNYSYEGAKIHKQGKGFLGFKIVKSENTSTNISNEITQTWENNSSYFLQSTETTIKKGSILLNRKTTSFSHNTINNTQGKKRYFQYPNAITSFNGLTNATTITSFNYINNWLNYKKTEYSGGTTEKVETYYTYTDLSTSEFNLKIPTTIINTRTLDGETFDDTTILSNFNSDKLPQQVSKNGFNTFIGYDAFGNVINNRITINGENRIEYFTYDNNGRFITERKKQSNGLKEWYGYDGMGNITSKTSVNGLNTQYFYDGFDRLIRTETPDGNIYENKYKWDITAGDSIEYYIHNIVPGGTDSWNYYDILGRKVKSETEGFKGQLFTNATVYNANGTVASETSQDKETTYTYKPDGRIASKTVDGNTTVFNYSGRTSSTTFPDGNTASKTYDGAGRLRTAADNGGSIAYKYAGCGKVDEMTYNFGKTITMGYDENGYQDWLNDPDAGYIDYDYNEIGELKSMTDASLNNTTYDYDVYGRLKYEHTPEGTITYTYNNSGNGTGRLQSVTGYNNISQSYTYDYLGRIETAFEQIQGVSSLLKSYVYDNYGNMITETYDADNDSLIELTLDYEYDKNILKKVKFGSQTLWQLNIMNNYGQITSYNLGSQLVTKNYDTHGFLSGIDYDNDYYMLYVFNHKTGNLTDRYNSYSNITETFTYDGLNRLKNIYQNGNLVHSTGYSITGNILSKTNAGYFNYFGIQPGAVTGISTEDGGVLPDGPNRPAAMEPTIPTDISTDAQVITYTSFNKTETISEGTNKNYSIVYGPGKNRKKMVKSIGNTDVTTYYHGNYEMQTGDDGTKQTFYINGLNGLAAIYRINNGTPTMYFVHTDHLGSIIALRNAATGAIEERYSYDAWGRRRNPLNYTYSGFTSNLTNRGFTGHEHLNEIGLINMNGRTYDPIIGRMLSPDNNIQMPDFSQNLNRYSYVMNNPLRFTDPSGESLKSWFNDNWITIANNIVYFSGAGALPGYFIAKKNGYGMNDIETLKYMFVSQVATAGSMLTAGAVTPAIGGFWGGAITGASGGAVGGFITGSGNGLIEGQNFSQAMGSGLKSGIIGGISGGLIGGTIAGLQAKNAGGDFLTGEIATQQVATTGEEVTTEKIAQINKEFRIKIEDNPNEYNIKIPKPKRFYEFIGGGGELDKVGFFTGKTTFRNIIIHFPYGSNSGNIYLIGTNKLYVNVNYWYRYF